MMGWYIRDTLYTTRLIHDNQQFANEQLFFVQLEWAYIVMNKWVSLIINWWWCSNVGDKNIASSCRIWLFHTWRYGKSVINSIFCCHSRLQFEFDIIRCDYFFFNWHRQLWNMVQYCWWNHLVYFKEGGFHITTLQKCIL